MEQNPEKLINFLKDLQKSQDEMYAKKRMEASSSKTTQSASPRTKKLAGLKRRSTPLKNYKVIIPSVDKNHGGIVFKAAAQTGTSRTSTEGVEYFENNGKQFTTLRQLEASIRKKMKDRKSG